MSTSFQYTQKSPSGVILFFFFIVIPSVIVPPSAVILILLYLLKISELGKMLANTDYSSHNFKRRKLNPREIKLPASDL